MASSPKISFRISDEMHAALTSEAKKTGKSPEIFARELIAKALRNKGLASMRPANRPKISDKI